MAEELTLDAAERKRIFLEVCEDAKKNTRWHHDIRFVGTEYVEHVVKKFQITKDERFLNQVIENYAIFRNGWAKQFSKYMDCDLEAGKIMHDEIVWKSCKLFDRSKARKGDGYAFNAYLVSAMLNQLKNHRNSQRANKNHPRVKCPVCGDEVFQIDHKHLKHVIDVDRYSKMYPNFPLVSHNGMTLDPVTGDEVDQIRAFGPEYTVADFNREFAHLFEPAVRACPRTRMAMREGRELSGGEVAEWYPPALMSGYSKAEYDAEYPRVAEEAVEAGMSWERIEEHFNLRRNKGMTAYRAYQAYKAGKKPPKAAPLRGAAADGLTYPEFAAIPGNLERLAGAREAGFKSPFTGQRMPRMTQKHLDEHFKKNPARRGFDEEPPYMTVKARQVPVTNPYTKQVVPEITVADLRDAGVTWKDHVETNCSAWIDRQYPFLIQCPFTGRKAKSITKDDLNELGKSVTDFCEAVSKAPLRKWNVRCAHCGEWVPNIWDHLAKKEHYYATSMAPEDFEAQYSTGGRKVVVTSNSYVQNDSGDVVHLADLFGKRPTKHFDPLEIEDSLLDVAEDEVDQQIARSFREARTLEDVIYTATARRVVKIPQSAKASLVRNGKQADAKAIRALVREKLGVSDFDITGLHGSKEVAVSIPSRDTIKKKLSKLVEASDL